VLLVYPANPSPYSLPIETTEHPAPLKEKDMTVRDVVFPPGRHALYERNRYSPAIKSDGLLFVSGQVGSREDG
jgi:enamine deaminase RidA (YjgF/YER057c/UK114 family)